MPILLVMCWRAGLSSALALLMLERELTLEILPVGKRSWHHQQERPSWGSGALARGGGCCSYHGSFGQNWCMLGLYVCFFLL